MEVGYAMFDCDSDPKMEPFVTMRNHRCKLRQGNWTKQHQCWGHSAQCVLHPPPVYRKSAGNVGRWAKFQHPTPSELGKSVANTDRYRSMWRAMTSFQVATWYSQVELQLGLLRSIFHDISSDLEILNAGKWCRSAWLLMAAWSDLGVLVFCPNDYVLETVPTFNLAEGCKRTQKFPKGRHSS